MEAAIRSAGFAELRLEAFLYIIPHVFFAPHELVSWVNQVPKLDTEALPFRRV
jgi:hypothetical protein